MRQDAAFFHAGLTPSLICLVVRLPILTFAKYDLVLTSCCLSASIDVDSLRTWMARLASSFRLARQRIDSVRNQPVQVIDLFRGNLDGVL